MENPSHSRPTSTLSKKTCNLAATAKRLPYDDVFGSSQRSSTLSPRVEDYREIFGALRSSRASSIPVLDLPLVEDDSEIFFDVRSSGFDYREVFSGFDAVDFAVSYEDLIMMEESNGHFGNPDSSEDDWTPAASESLSEAEASASEGSNDLRREEVYNEDGSDFSISFHKANPSNNGDSVPEYAFFVDDKASLGESCTENSNLDMDFSEEIMERKIPRKAVLLENDFTPRTCNVRNGFHHDQAFITVSNVSLRTQPSHLPPPSRPPPMLDVITADSSRGSSSSSKSPVSDITAGDSSPTFFDVEVDGYSTAAASAAAMKETMEKAQARMKYAKDRMQKKRENSQNSAKSGLKNDRKVKACNTAEASNDKSNEMSVSNFEIRGTEMKLSVREKRQKSSITTAPAPGSVVEKHLDETKISDVSEDQNEFWSIPEPDRFDIVDEWKEAIQFFELVKVDKSRETFEQADSANVLTTNSIQQESWKKGKRTALEIYKHGKKSELEMNPVRESYEREGYDAKFKEVRGACKHEKKTTLDRENEVSRSNMKSNVAQEACGNEENDTKFRMCQQPADCKKIFAETDESESLTDLTGEANIYAVCQNMKLDKYQYLKEDHSSSMESEARHKILRQKHENKNEQLWAYGQNSNEKKQKEATEREDEEKRLNETNEHRENAEKQRQTHHEENEKRIRMVLELERKGRRLQAAIEAEESEKKVREVCEREEDEKRVEQDLEREYNKSGPKEVIERDETEERQENHGEQNEKKVEEAPEHEANKADELNLREFDITEEIRRRGAEKEEIWEILEDLCEQELIIDAFQVSGESKSSGMQLHEQCRQREFIRTSNVDCELKEGEKTYVGVSRRVETNHTSEMQEQEKLKNMQEKTEVAQEIHFHLEGNDIVGVSVICPPSDGNKKHSTQPAFQHAEKSKKAEATKEAFALEKDGVSLSPTKANSILTYSEAVVQKLLVEENFDTPIMLQGRLVQEENGWRQKDIREPLGNLSLEKASDVDLRVEESYAENPKIASQNIDNQGKRSDNELREKENSTKMTTVRINQVEIKEQFMSTRVAKESVETGKKVEDREPAVNQGKGSKCKIADKVITSQIGVSKKNDEYEISPEQKEAEKTKKRERDLEQEKFEKLEKEREREREREKDRMAVDISGLEARDRAFSEARERAAVERMTAEARQRALAEARERLEKACAEAREKTLSDKASSEARGRMERSTSDNFSISSRNNGMKPSSSPSDLQNQASSEAIGRMERSTSDNFSISFRNNGMKPSSSPSDLHNQFQKAKSFGGLGHVHSSVYGASYHGTRLEGVEGESPQRCKARFERHQRTAERAAKALAEKNMRDLLAQREQAERSRLAESLDADVRRWSSGKEGNLRALLSTLQYILGPDSGWLPIPLTEVITSAAVKKAYRKATLCVHPDKLQQRGASIQQKYTCEKVFDLLKDAWNKFNSEER